MKCFSKKQTLLFFYDELNAQEKKLIEEHFSMCKHCSEKYESLNGLLSAIEKERVDISRDNLGDILKQIEPQMAPVSVLTRLGQKLSFIAEDLLTILMRRPQIAVVTLVIIAVISLLPIVNKKRVNMAKADVIDIEMELVFEDSNNTDVMLDIFNLDTSREPSSAHISS